ncbi:formate dehydrogenase subunit gamma [Symbiobacterium thermophilum]|uniref:formate dehydrogenase subunit gamma n=1 Tax=Symbiobacterium thermophilum TaxID=2734 RepID=UPI0023535DA0|nr:cytochrome b/b6 domain-containing protein [Symbiobacterium thermophilum]
MAHAKGSIKKFSRTQVLFHWLYAGSWIVLALTGSIFLWRGNPAEPAAGLGPLLHGSVGQTLRLVHRIAAIGLMFSPLVWLLGDPKTVWPDLKELFTLTKNDLKYMLIAPLYYTTGKGHLPPQGKFNGGHKVNFYVVFLTYFTFIGSGLVMWFGRGAVSDEAFHAAQFIHSLSFWLGSGLFLLHFYLTAVHPFTRRSLSAMVDGWTELQYARLEHGEWVEREIRNGTAQIRESEQAAAAR